MGYVVTLSSKGQLVIPAAVREALRLGVGDSLDVSFDADKSQITLTPVPTLDELSRRVTALARRSGAAPITDVDEYYQAHRDSRK